MLLLAIGDMTFINSLTGAGKVARYRANDSNNGCTQSGGGGGLGKGVKWQLQWSPLLPLSPQRHVSIQRPAPSANDRALVTCVRIGLEGEPISRELASAFLLTSHCSLVTPSASASFRHWRR